MVKFCENIYNTIRNNSHMTKGIRKENEEVWLKMNFVQLPNNYYYYYQNFAINFNFVDMQFSIFDKIFPKKITSQTVDIILDQSMQNCINCMNTG